jgi:sigma-B regulation protein RsbU (phosphoserine phosphatase)
VLLVDGDPSRRVFLSRRIREAGFDVHLAPDGGSALDLTRQLRPDVVLCSRRMAAIDGLDYCREVKIDPDLRTTYVAMVVDGDGREDMVEALDAGADDILAGTVDLEVLLAKVRAGIRAREVQRQFNRTQRQLHVADALADLGQKINSPLTGILGHLEMVRTYLERGEVGQVRRHLDEARRNVHRIGEVSQRLLATADPKASRATGDPFVLDLDGTVLDRSADATPVPVTTES